jgi:hypothetical protein
MIDSNCQNSETKTGFRKKEANHIQGSDNEGSSKFLSRSLKHQREWNNAFQVLEEKATNQEHNIQQSYLSTMKMR